MLLYFLIYLRGLINDTSADYSLSGDCNTDVILFERIDGIRSTEVFLTG